MTADPLAAAGRMGMGSERKRRRKNHHNPLGLGEREREESGEMITASLLQKKDGYMLHTCGVISPNLIDSLHRITMNMNMTQNVSAQNQNQARPTGIVYDSGRACLCLGNSVFIWRQECARLGDSLLPSDVMRFQHKSAYFNAASLDERHSMHVDRIAIIDEDDTGGNPNKGLAMVTRDGHLAYHINIRVVSDSNIKEMTLPLQRASSTNNNTTEEISVVTQFGPGSMLCGTTLGRLLRVTGLSRDEELRCCELATARWVPPLVKSLATRLMGGLYKSGAPQEVQQRPILKLCLWSHRSGGGGSLGFPQRAGAAAGGMRQIVYSMTEHELSCWSHLSSEDDEELPIFGWQFHLRVQLEDNLKKFVDKGVSGVRPLDLKRCGSENSLLVLSLVQSLNSGNRYALHTLHLDDDYSKPPKINFSTYLEKMEGSTGGFSNLDLDVALHTRLFLCPSENEEGLHKAFLFNPIAVPAQVYALYLNLRQQSRSATLAASAGDENSGRREEGRRSRMVIQRLVEIPEASLGGCLGGGVTYSRNNFIVLGSSGMVLSLRFTEDFDYTAISSVGAQAHPPQQYPSSRSGSGGAPRQVDKLVGLLGEQFRGWYDSNHANIGRGNNSSRPYLTNFDAVKDKIHPIIESSNRNDIGEAVAKLSRKLIDNCPSTGNAWSNDGSCGGQGDYGASQPPSHRLIQNILQDKRKRHEVFIHFLEEFEIWTRLGSDFKSRIGESAEKIAAAEAFCLIRGQCDSALAKLIDDGMKDAIRENRKKTLEALRAQGFTLQEYFFAEPSRLLEGILKVQEKLKSNGLTSRQSNKFHELVSGVTTLICGVFHAALDCRQENKILFQLVTRKSPWVTGGEDARRIIIDQLELSLSIPSDARQSILKVQVKDLTVMLLKGFKEEITGESDGSEMDLQWKEAYEAAKSVALKNVLYQKCRCLDDALELAEEHLHFETMVSINLELGRIDTLSTYFTSFKDTRGTQGDKFSKYLLEFLYNKNKLSELLDIGRNEPSILRDFLKDKPHLSWVNDLRMHDFNSVSKTLYNEAKRENKSLAAREVFISLGKLSRIANERLNGPGVDNDIKESLEEMQKMVIAQKTLTEELMSSSGCSNMPIKTPEQIVNDCINSIEQKSNVRLESIRPAMLGMSVLAVIKRKLKREKAKFMIEISDAESKERKLELDWNLGSIEKEEKASEEMLQDLWRKIIEHDKEGIWKVETTTDVTPEQLRRTLLYQAAYNCQEVKGHHDQKNEEFDVGITENRIEGICSDKSLNKHKIQQCLEEAKEEFQHETSVFATS